MHCKWFFIIAKKTILTIAQKKIAHLAFDSPTNVNKYFERNLFIFLIYNIYIYIFFFWHFHFFMLKQYRYYSVTQFSLEIAIIININNKKNMKNTEISSCLSLCMIHSWQFFFYSEISLPRITQVNRSKPKWLLI